MTGTVGRTPRFLGTGYGVYFLSKVIPSRLRKNGSQGGVEGALAA